MEHRAIANEGWEKQGEWKEGGMTRERGTEKGVSAGKLYKKNKKKERVRRIE